MLAFAIMAAGRPPIFNNAEEFENKVEAYFEQFTPTEDGQIKPVNNEKGPTITGLCLFLGFESRQSFHDYQEKSEFSYAFKRARFRIENKYESALAGNNAAGPIFALKNLGWKDTQEIKHEVQKSFFNLDPLADDQTNSGAQENSPA
jgi:hypothetical protein